MRTIETWTPAGPDKEQLDDVELGWIVVNALDEESVFPEFALTERFHTAAWNARYLP